MKYVRAFAAVILVLLAACGGDDGPQPTPSRSPDGGSQTATIAASETPGCGGSLPAGPVAFRGIVLSFAAAPFAEAGSEFFREIAEVMIQEIEVEEGAAEYKFQFEPGETAEVVLLGEGWPAVSRGDCVLVAGANHRYACGAACDAAGFVAEVFNVYPASPAKEN